MGNRKKKYDREMLVCYLQKLAKDLQESPSAAQMDRAKGYPNSTTFIAEFRTWNNALRASGLQLNKIRRYADEDLINLLRILAERMDRSPSYREMERASDFPDASVFSKRFGSWNKALIKAGFKPNKRKEKYSDTHSIKLLRRLAKRLGRSPSHEEMNNRPNYPCGNLFRERFGTWNKALERAGLETRGNPFVRKIIH